MIFVFVHYPVDGARMSWRLLEDRNVGVCDKEGAVQMRLNDKSAVDSHVDGG